MKEKYTKPTCQIILLPEEEFFTSSITSKYIPGQEDNDASTGVLTFKTSPWHGNSDGQTNWFD